MIPASFRKKDEARRLGCIDTLSQKTNETQIVTKMLDLFSSQEDREQLREPPYLGRQKGKCVKIAKSFKINLDVLFSQRTAKLIILCLWALLLRTSHTAFTFCWCVDYEILKR